MSLLNAKPPRTFHRHPPMSPVPSTLLITVNYLALPLSPLTLEDMILAVPQVTQSSLPEIQSSATVLRQD
jgi:hypothetical protein